MKGEVEPTLLHVEWGEGQAWTSLGGSLVLGSDPNCADLVLDDPEVEPRHARLCRVGDRVEIEDLGTGGGTFLRLGAGVEWELREGDVLRWRGDVLRFGQDGAGAVLERWGAGGVEGESVRLEGLVAGEGVGSGFRIRGGGTRWSLIGDGESREKTECGGQGGRGGTFIALRAASVLTPEDRFRVGRTELRARAVPPSHFKDSDHVATRSAGRRARVPPHRADG